jgi:hypothetical protein
MSDQKVREELEAAIKRGRDAEQTLAKLETLDLVAETNDLETFKKAVRGNHTKWATDPNKAEWYRSMMGRVAAEAEQALRQKGA